MKKNQDRKHWDFEQLRLYLNYVKSLKPNLTADANLVIQNYYASQRSKDDRNAARTTVRMLESVIRLSQAHAKLMLRENVLVMDAVVAITLIECSLNKTDDYFSKINILHTSFPADSEKEYRYQLELILGRLGLKDLLARELDFIDNNYEPFCTSNNSSHSTSFPASTFSTSYSSLGRSTTSATTKTSKPRSDDVVSQLVAVLPSFNGTLSTSVTTAATCSTSQMNKKRDMSVLLDVDDDENGEQNRTMSSKEISLVKEHTAAKAFKRPKRSEALYKLKKAIDDEEKENTILLGGDTSSSLNITISKGEPQNASKTELKRFTQSIRDKTIDIDENEFDIDI